jgi:hypothetical protein
VALKSSEAAGEQRQNQTDQHQQNAKSRGGANHRGSA